MANYTESFEKPFTDIKKLLIGILLSIIPIINWFAVGFEMNCSNVGNVKTKKLPEWGDFGNLFIKGFFNFAITVIYILPAIILTMISAGSVIATLITKIPWDQVSNVTQQESAKLIQPVIQSSLPSIIAAIPFLIISGILFLIAIYMVPMAVLSYIENEKFSDAFNLSKVFKKSFTGKYLVAWIALTAIGMVLGSILNFIPIIGSAAAVFIVGVIGFSLFGQIYLETDQAKKSKASKK